MLEGSSGDTVHPLEVEGSAAVTHEGACTWVAVPWRSKPDTLWVICPKCHLTAVLKFHVEPEVPDQAAPTW
jgi:hypothetical protein